MVPAVAKAMAGRRFLAGPQIMAKEIVESRFFLQIDGSFAAPLGALKAYSDAKTWSLGIPTTDKAYAGASLHPGVKDGLRGFFVERYIEESPRSSSQD